MELVQARIVTEDVEALAAFYARLVGSAVTLNAYRAISPAAKQTRMRVSLIG